MDLLPRYFSYLTFWTLLPPWLLCWIGSSQLVLSRLFKESTNVDVGHVPPQGQTG